MGERDTVRVIDGDPVVSVGQVIAALEQAQALLEPGVVQVTQNRGQIDEPTLGGLVDAALIGLRERVVSAKGAAALAIASVGFELADLARQMRSQALDRQADGPACVQRALAELRGVGSAELMLKRCSQVVCERCGFDRAVLWRIEDDTVFPASAFDRRDKTWASKVMHSDPELPRPVLGDMPIETEMFRRRVPAIVHQAQNGSRTFKELLTGPGAGSYVAAPIVPEGRVVGFLHADIHYQRREVDVIDRDVLWAFAEGCGYALERTMLRDEVRQQRQRIRELLRTADELANEIGETEFRMKRTEAAATGAAAPVPAGGSRVHSLLTPREIEVVELLVHGATNKEIAERLVVGEPTVKSHVNHVFRKLHACNRAEAAYRYMRLVNLDQG